MTGNAKAVSSKAEPSNPIILHRGFGSGKANAAFRVGGLLLAVMLLAAAPALAWEHWGGDRGGQRFSPLAQITPANVGNLVRAWEFRTGDLERRAPAVMARTKFQATPLLVEDSLIFCSPFNEVIALDPGSGAQKWRFDPKISTEQRPANRYNCRGVAWWVDDQAAEGAACRARDIHGHQRRPRDRARCPHRHSLRRFRHRRRDQDRDRKQLEWPGEFQITSAPVVSRGVVMVGSAICRQPPRRRAARHGARLRCADRAAALEFGSADPRRHQRGPRQCLGADVGGRGARAGVPADVVAEPGFLGRQAARQQRARQFGGRAARRDRRTGVVVPDRASRRLGLRPAGAADAGAHRYRRRACATS